MSGQYRFRHALYQQVFYRRLAAVRRVQGYRRIGARLEAGYGARMAEIAPELAMHFERGQDTERAVTYHTQAGQQALVRSAHQEAISHVTTGLKLRATLPEPSRQIQTELKLQAILGTVLLATQGYTAPAVARAYQRVRELTAQAPETPEVFQALWGLYQFHTVRGEHQQAQALAEQLLALARRAQDQVALVVGYFAVGGTGYYLGEFATSCTVLAQAEACYARQQHSAHIARHGVDMGVFCGSFTALPLWCSGYPDHALKKCRAALTLAQDLGHPYSTAVALARVIQVHKFRREAAAACAGAEALITFATEQGFAHYVALSRNFQAWSLAVQGGAPPAIAQLRQSLVSLQATGIKMAQAQQCALLAELQANARQVANGLESLAEAWELVEQTGEGYYVAELHRLKGELLLQHNISDAPQAEACFNRALDLARRQQARSWELRAAVSLSRLWQCQGKRAAVRALLEPIYAWFTEGFETADLQEARGLLEELS